MLLLDFFFFFFLEICCSRTWKNNPKEASRTDTPSKDNNLPKQPFVDAKEIVSEEKKEYSVSITLDF